MANRNSNAHFSLAPQVEIERSTFDRSCNVHTSMNVGDLIVFYWDEILPGDTFEIQTSKVARLQTLIAPVMDNLYLDTYYFFVPNRLVWDDWKFFMGENDRAWYPETVYRIPKVSNPTQSNLDTPGWNQGTLADYMGLPIYADVSPVHFAVNALPFRAYALIWNEWFRDENLQDCLLIPTDEGGTTTGSQVNPVYGGKIMKANKYHDYFTSCLPGPLKAPETPLIEGIMPVRTYSGNLIQGTGTPMRMITTSGGVPSGNKHMVTNGSDVKQLNTTSSETVGNALMPSNLYVNMADLRIPEEGGLLGDVSALTINGLRQAFQIQRLLERDARGGTRYIELLKSHFSVTSPDARLQRPEYLGGNRIPLNIEQVVNTTGNQQMQLLPGDVSGWSQTSDSHFDVQKSFVEHGYILGLMVARYDHTYQQGVERAWSRENRLDFYWPALAHLGEQPVYKKELMVDVANSDNEPVFGYQEAWAEYRYKPNYVTGAMRSALNNSLDMWHFADWYEDEPYLSNEWIQEDKNNVDRALAVKSTVENQIFMDIFVKNKATRPMPLYSIPGFIDHF